jgi:hypothetical protein
MPAPAPRLHKHLRICRIASLDKSTRVSVSPPVVVYPSLNSRYTMRCAMVGEGGEIRSRDLLCRQSAHLVQRQCGLCISIQRWGSG